MREKAKKVLEKLKKKSKVFSDSFDEYVKGLAKELGVKEDLAAKLVTDELVNRNQKKLLLYGLFSKETLEENKSELPL